MSICDVESRALEILNSHDKRDKFKVEMDDIE